jgi:hypothetical protein
VSLFGALPPELPEDDDPPLLPDPLDDPLDDPPVDAVPLPLVDDPDPESDFAAGFDSPPEPLSLFPSAAGFDSFGVPRCAFLP